MNDFNEYINAPITFGDIPHSKYRRFNTYQVEKRRIRNIKEYNNQLFIKAIQNLRLMQADIEFARQSISHQAVCINQISSLVSYGQKEIDLLSLDENYKVELQQLRDGYKKKVDSYKEKVEFANQSNITLLKDINQQADEAEREAKKLTIANREQIKKEVDEFIENKNKELKQQLKEAKNELDELQKLSDKAAIARKRIDDFHSIKNQNIQRKAASNISSQFMAQQTIKHKSIPSTSRVADRFRAYQEKEKSTHRNLYSPSNL